MRRWLLGAALLLLTVTVVLAGCGKPPVSSPTETPPATTPPTGTSPTETPPTGTPPTTTPPTGTPPTVTPPTTTPPEVAPHGELVLAAGAPWTLDPALSSEISSYQYIVQIFSGLVRLDETLNTVPDIAERWEISEDGRVYTFYLRRDVEFHDGRGVNAASVKDSWERACWPETGSQTVANYLGDIIGVTDVIAGRTRQISGVRVIDDYVLEVNIDTPKSYFISKLGHPATFVVDTADMKRGAEWWQRPNGTGPFRVTKLDLEAEMILGRNADYHGERAKLERVVYQFFTTTAIQLYETDQVDVAGVSLAYIDRAADPAGPFAGQLQSAPEISYYYVAFNFTEPPFDDPLIRRAFSLALDRERMVSLIYRDMVTQAQGVLPPGLPGHDPALTGLPYDPQAALELIRQSSYGSVDNLPPLTLTDSGYGGVVSGLTEAMVALWRETLGVEISVRQVEPMVFFYELNEELDQIYSIGWIADYPHPQNFLDVLFRSGSAYNHGGYSDPAFDALIDRANTEPDWARAQALYRQAERILVDDAVCIPLTFGQNFYLVKPYVEGYQLNPIGVVMLNRVSVTR
jgi:oligopeptide transport system substrate-binding protein